MYDIDKTIKLWKVSTQKRYLPMATTANGVGKTSKIVLPTVDETVPRAEMLQATAKRIYANAHAYHINSLALNTDGETFFSADDLRVNWWRLDNSDTTFSKYLVSKLSNNI